MAEIPTVARPYAEAVFRSAIEKNTLASAAEGLALAAAIARDESMHSVLGNPKVSAQQKKELFAAGGAGRIDAGVTNLLSILVDAHREVLIGSIAEQFEELKNEHEKVVRARITSAQPLSDPQRDEI